MATENGPAPFTRPDCDLRDMDGFMLNVERLLASELWALSTGEELKGALALWCRAWKQIPAASLPADERVLMAFAGVAAPRWRKIRDMVMRGFVLCSDGRYYHRVLSEDANRAWERKLKFRERGQRGNEKRWNKDSSQPHSDSHEGSHKESLKGSHKDSIGIAEASQGDPSSIPKRSLCDPFSILSDRQVQGQRHIPSFGRPAEPASVDDCKNAMWKEGLATVRALTGDADGTARKLLGKLVDLAGGDHARVLALIRRAEVFQPSEVKPWLIAGAKSRDAPSEIAAPERPKPSPSNPAGRVLAQLSSSLD